MDIEMMKNHVNSLEKMFKQKNIEAHKDKSGISILGSKNYIKNTELDLDLNPTSGRGRLWWPALGVVKTLHTDNTQHKDNMKT